MSRWVMMAVMAWACALSAAAWGQSTPTARPNFIVIMADDLGYGDLSAYAGWIHTPALDALAKSGLRFTDYHSNGNVCSPTRAALMTGRYQQRAGIDQVINANPAAAVHEHGIGDVEATMAELLKAEGYRTAIFGKWHLGYKPRFNPTRHGFDEFVGYISGNVDFFSHADQAGRHDWWHGAVNTPEEGYTTHLITKHALRFLESAGDKPFLLYLPYEPPHAPYQGPNDPVQRQVGETKGGGAKKDDPQRIKRAYTEMVQEMDKGIGEIVAALRRLGLAENTLVIFTSDNGGTSFGSNGPLRGTKGTDYEGGHRVPLIAAWPGKIRPGVTDATAMSMDVLPTLLELAGAAKPVERKFDGVSLAGLLLRGESLPERTLVWNGKAIRQGKWKLVRDQRDQKAVALYDLAADLGEKNDLAAKEPQRAASMLQQLETWEKDVRSGATEQPAGAK